MSAANAARAGNAANATSNVSGTGMFPAQLPGALHGGFAATEEVCVEGASVVAGFAVVLARGTTSGVDPLHAVKPTPINKP